MQSKINTQQTQNRPISIVLTRGRAEPSATPAGVGSGGADHLVVLDVDRRGYVIQYRELFLGTHRLAVTTRESQQKQIHYYTRHSSHA